MSHLTFQIKWRGATSYEHCWTAWGIGQSRLSATTSASTGNVTLMFRIVLTLLQDLMAGTAFLTITILMVFMLQI